MTGRKTRFLAVFLAALFVLSVAVMPMASAAASGELNYGADAADPIWFDGDVTVSKHDMSEGATHADMSYEDDEGLWVDDPIFNVNTSIGENVESDEEGNRNPYSFKPGHIEDEDFLRFPMVGDDEDDDSTDAEGNEDNLASWQDASEWTEEVNASEGSLSETTVAANVEALRIDTGSSMVAGDSYVVKYDNWTSEYDSDEDKRVLQFAIDVDTLDAATNYNLSFHDESGDYKMVEIDSSLTAGDTGVVAASTGDSNVYQIKLSKLTTHGSGSWDNIETLRMNVTDGDFDGSVSWISIDDNSKDSFGEKIVDDDDDDSDYDNTEEQYNATGSITISEPETMDAEFDDAHLTDLTYPFKAPVSELNEAGDDGEYRITWATSEKYGQPNVLTEEYRLELPDAVDLSFSSVTLEMEQAWPDGRYVELKTVEGAGEELFSDLEDDDKYTDQSGSLASEGDEIEIDGTISVGTEYAIKKITTFSDAEKQTVEASMMPGGGGGPVSGGSSGGLDFLVGLPGAILAGAIGFGSRLLSWGPLKNFPWVL